MNYKGYSKSVPHTEIDFRFPSRAPSASAKLSPPLASSPAVEEEEEDPPEFAPFTKHRPIHKSFKLNLGAVVPFGGAVRSFVSLDYYSFLPLSETGYDPGVVVILLFFFLSQIFSALCPDHLLN